jgi:hypothetical protein
MRNVTSGGNWLTVRVEGKQPGQNTMGIGAIVRVYAAGHLGDARHQLGRRDIAVGTGYASTEEALAHFGLDDAATCDIEVTWLGRRAQRRGVAANQFLSLTVE